MAQIEYVQNKESGLSVRTKINQAIGGVNSLNSANYTTLQYITNLIVDYYKKSETYNKIEINDIVSSIKNLEPKIIQNINEVTELGYVYFLPVGEEGINKYDEYLYINGIAELIGSFNSDVDLSNYITTEQLNTAFFAYVSKETGKELIPTTALTKLNSLPTKIESDNFYVAKEAGKSLIEDVKIEKLDALPSSVFSQVETQQAINTAIDAVDINLQGQINTHESQIQDIVTAYIDNKGYFATLPSLKASHPNPEIGDIAYVADALSSTGYYIYNVVDGIWTSSTVEAPPVAVPIGDYILKTTVSLYNITNEIPLPAGSYYTLATAIAAIPTNIRKLGLKITFQVSATNTETWEFFNGTIGNITNVAYWRKTANSTDLSLKIDKTAIKQALGTSPTDVMSQKAITDELGAYAKKSEVDSLTNIWVDGGYVHKRDGMIIKSSNHLHSQFMLLIDRGGLIVSGMSGAISNVALVSFYDPYLVYLGSYNTDVNGHVEDELIPEEEIPIETKYIRVTGREGLKNEMQGVAFDNSYISYEPYNLNPENIWHKENGYIHILDGSVIDGDGEFSTFLKIVHRNNITVSGVRQGANIPAIAFYDVDFNYIGNIYIEGGGVAIDRKIAAEEIPEKAMYLRISKSSSSSLTGISGVLPLPMFSKHFFTDTHSTEVGGIDINGGNDRSELSFKSTDFLKIVDKNNIIVLNGKVNSNIVMVAFYDSMFRFISSYSPTYISERSQIPIDVIPSGAVYIKTSHQNGKTNVVSGVQGYKQNNFTTERLIDTKISEIPEIPEIVDKFKYFPYDDRAVNKEAALVIGKAVLDVYILHPKSGKYYSITNISHLPNGDILIRGHEQDTSTGTPPYHNILEETISKLETGKKVITSRLKETIIYLLVDLDYIRTRPTTGYINGKPSMWANEYPLHPEVFKRGRGVISEYTSNRPVLKANSIPNVSLDGHIKMLNYLGNYENIHPKVLYFEDGWNGYNFWMAYTPYPSGATGAENPSIGVSNDGFNWETPEGLTNPLAFSTDDPYTYNSDTHLLYREDTDVLEIWWRPYTPSLGKESIVRRTSTNGINWSETEVAIPSVISGAKILSPSIIFEDGKYKMWVVADKLVEYMETPGNTITEWSDPIILPLALAENNIAAWHMDVLKTGNVTEFVIQGNTLDVTSSDTDLYYVKEVDGVYSDPIVILERGVLETDPDYAAIYRSCIVKVGEFYYLYYSSISKGREVRALNLSIGRHIDRLRGINL